MNIIRIVEALYLARKAIVAGKDVYALVLRGLRWQRERVVLSAHAACRVTVTATLS